MTIHLLLVEDNPADAELTMDTFESSSLPLHVHHVLDGDAALDFLLRRNGHRDAPKADLVLLDLNLPRRSGTDVLRELRRTDGELSLVPVVVLSSSDAERDVLASYRLGANSYVRKPNDLRGYRDVMARIEGFWLSLAILPR